MFLNNADISLSFCHDYKTEGEFDEDSNALVCDEQYSNASLLLHCQSSQVDKVIHRKQLRKTLEKFEGTTSEVDLPQCFEEEREFNKVREEKGSLHSWDQFVTLSKKRICLYYPDKPRAFH
jgi:hypothetical protein